MPDRIRILIIDDEEVVCSSCERFLKEEGYDVRTVFSGRDGIRLIDENNYDIVITDLKMPGMSGMDILDHIKKGYPGMRVIMMTGYSTAANAEESLRRGASGYIQKPFAPSELLSVIVETLKKQVKSPE
ncbi:MAG: response regulator [Spirochaetes bacterium]|nr:response regulator [Spirochaetota bacterium]